MYEFHAARGEGQSLPVAITHRHHPLHTWARWSTPIRRTCGNSRSSAAVRRALSAARCGVADLEVPASAEIIIEGEILAGVHEPEGPFGEFTGYASYRSTQNVFVAKRIRMRRDAIYHSVVSGMSQDHILVSCITREGEILNALRRNLPNVRAVHVPHTTCGAFMAIVSMKKIAEGEPQMAMMATFGTELYTKHVIVVDDDVDIYNMNDVMWAIATRVRAGKGHRARSGMQGRHYRPHLGSANLHVTKMGIDATRPATRTLPSAS
jgi:UbiD family decarboxylase